MSKTQVKFTTKRICTMGILLGLSVILGGFSIRVGLGIKISLKFIPVFISAILFGPLYGAICGGLSDLLSFWFFPTGGDYLPLISVIEALYGLMFGLFFYNKSQKININSVFRIIACLLINTVVFGLFSMSFILMSLLKMSYVATMIMRIPSLVINFVLHFTVILFILKNLNILKRTCC